MLRETIRNFIELQNRARAIEESLRDILHAQNGLKIEAPKRKRPRCGYCRVSATHKKNVEKRRVSKKQHVKKNPLNVMDAEIRELLGANVLNVTRK